MGLRSVFPIDYKRDRRACGNVGIAERFPRAVERVEILVVGFPGFPPPVISTCVLGLMESQAVPECDAQGAMKDVPMRVQKTQRHRSV
jgi:hypothetical protein